MKTLEEKINEGMFKNKLVKDHVNIFVGANGAMNLQKTLVESIIEKFTSYSLYAFNGSYKTPTEVEAFEDIKFGGGRYDNALDNVQKLIENLGELSIILYD